MSGQDVKILRGEKFIKTVKVQDKPRGRGFQVTIPKEAGTLLGLKGDERAWAIVDVQRKRIIFALEEGSARSGSRQPQRDE